MPACLIALLDSFCARLALHRKMKSQANDIVRTHALITVMLRVTIEDLKQLMEASGAHASTAQGFAE